MSLTASEHQQERCRMCDHTEDRHTQSMGGCGGWQHPCPCPSWAGAEFDPQPWSPSLRDEFVRIMNDEGAAGEGGFHSWRCFDRDRYPEPCQCTETVAKMLVAAALRDAVEAVKAELAALKPIIKESRPLLTDMDVVAQAEHRSITAIEALGGER